VSVDLAHADIVLVRHGETTYNAAGLLNGDPSVDVPLTERGIEQCRALRPLLEPLPWATVVVTPFKRTRQTLEEMLPGREPVTCPDLGDICLGVLESQPRPAYRTWRETHGVGEAPDGGGESRLAVVERYARAFRRLAEETAHPTLVVTHDQPIRYLLNALAGDDPIRGPARPVPNAVPYPFTAAEVAEGARHLEASLR
jgi:broad specificity phosphatase PhoE